MNKIRDFKNVHDGKRVFILASGPSLAEVDLKLLARRLVIGLNRSALIFPDSHYHCTMDQRLFDEHPEVLRQTRFLFTLVGRPWGIPLKLLGSEGFSWDLEQGIYSGYTVSYFALQVAVYMGFKEIVYVGLDLQHDGPKTHFFGADFHSRNHPDTEFPRMAKMLAYGARSLAGTGVKVFNCSPVFELDCFARISYDDAVSL